MEQLLLDALKQSPIVVIAGFVAWYAYREVKKANADMLSTLKAASEKLERAKDAEIARLTKDLKDEVRKLAKEVKELNERLSP